MCQTLPDIVSDSLHRAKNCHPETMSQIFPHIVSDSLHLAKSCPPETMCRISPNFAKLWSSITPKRQTMGAWQTPHWNREVKIKLFKKKFEPESPGGLADPSLESGGQNKAFKKNLNRSPPSDENFEI